MRSSKMGYPHEGQIGTENAVVTGHSVTRRVHLIDSMILDDFPVEISVHGRFDDLVDPEKADFMLMARRSGSR